MIITLSMPLFWSFYVFVTFQVKLTTSHDGLQAEIRRLKDDIRATQVNIIRRGKSYLLNLKKFLKFTDIRSFVKVGSS